jgi:DNA-binding transcriptional LysR family regulator
MKIDTLGLQAFVAIAERQSFQKAAGALHITQTALTRRLQNIEGFLGVKLVERTTRSVELTLIGGDFLPQARRLLDDLAAALLEIRESGKAMRGDVCIACVPTAGVQYLPHIIRRYSARYPHNRIKILDHASNGVAAAVLRREAEFGINVAEPRDADLMSVPLLRDRFVLICRDDHPLAARTRVPWRALRDHPLIFAGTDSSNRPLLDVALGGARTSLQGFYEVQRSSTAVGLVAAGVAAAVVPALALQAGTYPSVKVIALTDPVVSRELVLITRRSGALSPAAQALYDMIVDQRGEAQAPAKTRARNASIRSARAAVAFSK